MSSNTKQTPVKNAVPAAKPSAVAQESLLKPAQSPKATPPKPSAVAQGAAVAKESLLKTAQSLKATPGLMISSSQFVAKEVYGYVIITAIAIIIALFGLFLIYQESKKESAHRDPTKIIIGICVCSCGGVLMILMITFLMIKHYS